MTVLDGALLAVRATLARTAQAFRLLTFVERIAFAVAGINLGLIAGLLWHHRDLTHWLAGVGFVSAVVLLLGVTADAVIERGNAKRNHAAMIKLNAMKPSGAPRVAEVTCIHGAPHRYVYGPTGWENAGPAIERRPEPEEVAP